LEDKTNDEFDTRVELKELTARAREMIQVLPWLRDVNFLRAFSGITEITPDREPYIGVLPGVSGFYTASGFSGQGFCLGPMVGKIMAELVTGREPSVSLSSFKPERFASA
jgi:sarcosine oxidase subunit beta